MVVMDLNVWVYIDTNPFAWILIMVTVFLSNFAFEFFLWLSRCRSYVKRVWSLILIVISPLFTLFNFLFASCKQLQICNVTLDLLLICRGHLLSLLDNSTFLRVIVKVGA